MKKLLPLLLLLPAFAAADVAFNITAPASQSTPPGGISNTNCVNGSLSCLIFSGNITPGSVDTYVNDIQITFTPPSGSLSNNDNFFFSNVPGFFASTDPRYSGPVFEIDIAFDALPGTYNGTATLLGGTVGPSDAMDLAFDTFTVVVLAPEPSALWLTALGLIMCWAGSRAGKPAFARAYLGSRKI